VSVASVTPLSLADLQASTAADGTSLGQYIQIVTGYSQLELAALDPRPAYGSAGTNGILASNAFATGGPQLSPGEAGAAQAASSAGARAPGVVAAAVIVPIVGVGAACAGLIFYRRSRGGCCPGAGGSGSGLARRLLRRRVSGGRSPVGTVVPPQRSAGGAAGGGDDGAPTAPVMNVFRAASASGAHMPPPAAVGLGGTAGSAVAPAYHPDGVPPPALSGSGGAVPASYGSFSAYSPPYHTVVPNPIFQAGALASGSASAASTDNVQRHQ
jgi:hypothetical protein